MRLSLWILATIFYYHVSWFFCDSSSQRGFTICSCCSRGAIQKLTDSSHKTPVVLPEVLFAAVALLSLGADTTTTTPFPLLEAPPELWSGGIVQYLLLFLWISSVLANYHHFREQELALGSNQGYWHVVLGSNCHMDRCEPERCRDAGVSSVRASKARNIFCVNFELYKTL